jgi:hypothetical protein
MPYGLKLYLYLGVGFVVAIVVSDQWLRHLSSTVVLGFRRGLCGVGDRRGSVVVRTEESVGLDLPQCHSVKRFAG